MLMKDEFEKLCVIYIGLMKELLCGGVEPPRPALSLGACCVCYFGNSEDIFGKY